MTTVVEAYPSATEVAVIHVPAGSVARVHHPSEVQEYTPMLPDVEDYAVVPGCRTALGWGWSVGWYGDLTSVRNGRHRLDRPVWHDAARTLKGGGVVYVQYEALSYYGRPRWSAVSVRREAAAERIGAVRV